MNAGVEKVTEFAYYVVDRIVLAKKCQWYHRQARTSEQVFDVRFVRATNDIMSKRFSNIRK